MVQPCVLFDFDNTIASTGSIKEIRESGDYSQLTSDAMSKVRLYKPVRNLLQTLKAQGVALGVVTNSGAGYIRQVFKHLELEGVFDTVVTYSDVKAEGMKPSPAGLKLALQNLGIPATTSVLYVGDHYTDIIAAYQAGITPIMPSWASRDPVSTAPAFEMSSEMLMSHFVAPDEFTLFAERCADESSAHFERKGVYFLPLDGSGNVVTLKEEMTTFCLGRYFSQKSAVTASLHDAHALSMEIVRKEEENPYVIPDYWYDMLAHVVRHGGEFLFDLATTFDVVSVIPSKKGKDQRLERLLDGVAQRIGASAPPPEFINDLFYFVDDAQSQKLLHRNERYLEANRALQLNPAFAQRLAGLRVLVIDDIITTGATLERAQLLLRDAGAMSAIGLAIAKTVSIAEQEKACPVCQRSMRLRRNSNTGDRFWGCTGYADESAPCNHTEPFYRKPCSKCGRLMVVRLNRRDGSKFWGCTGYSQNPQCSRTEEFDPREIQN